MTREEAIKYIKSRCIGSTEERDGTQWSEAMWAAIEALADRPTESDFISKAKVLETYSELYWFDIDCGVVSKAEVDKIYERLQSLPSADRRTVDKEYLIDLIQEAVYDGEACAKLIDLVDRPTGEWICMGDVGVTECNQCGWSIEEYVGDYKFCPNCGAKMGGDSE